MALNEETEQQLADLLAIDALVAGDGGNYEAASWMRIQLRIKALEESVESLNYELMEAREHYGP